MPGGVKRREAHLDKDNGPAPQKIGAGPDYPGHRKETINENVTENGMTIRYMKCGNTFYININLKIQKRRGKEL